MRIHHIAVVTRNLEEAKAFYLKLGFVATKVFDVGEQYPGENSAHHYRAVALKGEANDRPAIWLMEPASKEGPLGRFLERRGPGIHHIGLLVDDVRVEATKAQEQGIKFVRPPHEFPEDSEIRALIDPHDGDGVLIELVQRVEK